MTQADIAKSYLEVLTNDLDMQSTDNADLSQFVAELRKVDTSKTQRGPFPRLQHPTMDLLETVLANAGGNPALQEAASKAARVLDWGQIYDGGGLDPDLAEGMLASQAAGTYGCFAGETIATGLFLLAPGIHYALHTHEATEIYYCLSGTIDIQHGIDAKPFALTAGAYSITPSGRVHSLTTGSEPVLMIYAWVGQLKCPIWLWSQDGNGGWQRERWMREPGEPWKVMESEAVSDEAMAQARG